MWVSGDEGFAEEVSGYNLATILAPAIIVGATSGEDVAAAVRFAVAEGLPVAVQATGHGAFVPAQDSLLISTKRMTKVSVDAYARVARVQAGVRWSQVIDAAAPHGLAPINGSSPLVGVVGFTLGGGMGPLSRKFGFAADQVRKISFVAADGVERTVDQDTNPDLFWAMLGGKGNFGIVTELEFALFPVARIYGGGIFYPAEVAAPVLRAYVDWAETLPEATTTSLAFLRLPPLPELPESLRGKFVVHLRVAHVGPADEGERLLSPMRAVADSLIDSVRDMPYSEVGSIHQDPVDPNAYWESGTLLGPLPSQAVDTILEAVGPTADLVLQLFELRQMGGALHDAPAFANAVGGRDAKFSVLLITGTGGGLEAGRILEALAPFGTGNSLLNFQGNASTPEQVARAWSPEVYARLRAIKRAHDPSNVFRFGHNIPPAD